MFSILALFSYTFLVKYSIILWQIVHFPQQNTTNLIDKCVHWLRPTFILQCSSKFVSIAEHFNNNCHLISFQAWILNRQSALILRTASAKEDANSLSTKNTLMLKIRWIVKKPFGSAVERWVDQNYRFESNTTKWIVFQSGDWWIQQVILIQMNHSSSMFTQTVEAKLSHSLSILKMVPINISMFFMH